MYIISMNYILENDNIRLTVSDHGAEIKSLLRKRDNRELMWQADQVTLVDDQGEDVLSVKFDAPLFGIWSPAGKHAPFVCIEPWYGRCDRVGFCQELSEREYGNVLEASEIFQVYYDIQVI